MVGRSDIPTVLVGCKVVVVEGGGLRSRQGKRIAVALPPQWQKQFRAMLPSHVALEYIMVAFTQDTSHGWRQVALWLDGSLARFELCCKVIWFFMYRWLSTQREALRAWESLIHERVRKSGQLSTD